MKIAVLSRNPRLYSTRRLVEAGRERGHEMVVIDTLRAYMNIASHKPQIHYRGQPLEGFDAVIPRIGASVTFYGCAVLRQFEMMGVFPLNESVAIARSRDKLRSLQLLSRKGIGLPVTGFAHSPDDVPDLIEMVGGAPLVIKLLEGTQGIGVVLCETEKAAESVLEAFMGLKHNIMVQEYIKEAGGADIRCFVVGDKVIASMKRQAAPGEFPLQPAPRRQRQPDQDHPGRTHDRHPRRPRDGPERRRGGHPALQPWSSGNGGELLAGPGRYRIHYRQGHRRDHHPVPGKERRPPPGQDEGKGVSRTRQRMRCPGASDAPHYAGDPGLDRRSMPRLNEASPQPMPETPPNPGLFRHSNPFLTLHGIAA